MYNIAVQDMSKYVDCRHAVSMVTLLILRVKYFLPYKTINVLTNNIYTMYITNINSTKALVTAKLS